MRRFTGRFFGPRRDFGRMFDGFGGGCRIDWIGRPLVWVPNRGLWNIMQYDLTLRYELMLASDC